MDKLLGTAIGQVVEAVVVVVTITCQGLTHGGDGGGLPQGVVGEGVAAGKQNFEGYVRLQVVMIGISLKNTNKLIL